MTVSGLVAHCLNVWLPFKEINTSAVSPLDGRIFKVLYSKSSCKGGTVSASLAPTALIPILMEISQEGDETGVGGRGRHSSLILSR